MDAALGLVVERVPTRCRVPEPNMTSSEAAKRRQPARRRRCGTPRRLRPASRAGGNGKGRGVPAVSLMAVAAMIIAPAVPLSLAQQDVDAGHEQGQHQQVVVAAAHAIDDDDRVEAYRVDAAQLGGAPTSTTTASSESAAIPL